MNLFKTHFTKEQTTAIIEQIHDEFNTHSDNELKAAEEIIKSLDINGTKKSLKGFQFVSKDKTGNYVVESEVTEEKAYSPENKLKVIFEDGEFFNQTTLTEIRERVNQLI